MLSSRGKSSRSQESQSAARSPALGAFLCVMAFITQLPEASLTAQVDRAREVLILNSYRSDYAWTIDLVRGIESALESERIEFWNEYMDAPRRSPTELHGEL